MLPRFTKGEYWILETAVESAIPVSFLFASNLGETFNKKGHGLDRDTLLQTLMSLFQRGLIIARRTDDIARSFPLDEEGILACIDEAKGDEVSSFQAQYRLTAEGGSQWEAFASPDWDEYIYRVERPSGSETGVGWCTGVMASQTRWRVESLLETARFMGQAVDFHHVRRWIMRPWQATYWRDCPRAISLVIVFRSMDLDPNDPCWNFRRFERLFDNRWYHWM